MSDDLQKTTETTEQAMDAPITENTAESSSDAAMEPQQMRPVGDSEHIVTPEESTRQPNEPASIQAFQKQDQNQDQKNSADKNNRRKNSKRRDSRNEKNSRRPHSGSGVPRTAIRPAKRFVAVTWSGQREPVDNMFWAEAEREGEWVVFKSLEQIRTRREILEKISGIDEGIVGLEFNFSFPKPFLEFLTGESGVTDWRSLQKKVREEMKKNADDGARIWIDRMGKYRESALESEDDAAHRANLRNRNPRDRNFRETRREPIPVHERRSTAERFRRTDLTLRRVAENHLVSPIQIAYNRLTSRYEFNDPGVRGRGALLGMSMIEQLLETKPDIAVWPFMKPKALTLVELQPWIFTKGKTLKPDELRRMIALHEDAGWEVPSQVRDAAARNPDAQRAFLSVLSMIKTESREERANRPLRDYQDSFYNDLQVQAEGWFYGVGYRSPDEPKRGEKRPASKANRPDRERVGRHSENSETSSVENPIVDEPSAEETQFVEEHMSSETSSIEPAAEN